MFMSYEDMQTTKAQISLRICSVPCCSLPRQYTVNFLSFRTPGKLAVIILKFVQRGWITCVMHPNGEDRMENSGDPDQTAQSYLVANPEDRFSCDVAHLSCDTREMGHIKRKPVYPKLEQQRRRSACADLISTFVWSESSLSTWRNLGPSATHWVHSEDSDQTGRMPRLIWVFARRTLILLVLSCRGSNGTNQIQILIPPYKRCD